MKLTHGTYLFREAGLNDSEESVNVVGFKGNSWPYIFHDFVSSSYVNRAARSIKVSVARCSEDPMKEHSIYSAHLAV